MVFHHLVYDISLINIYEYTSQEFCESPYLIEFLNHFVNITDTPAFVKIINTNCLLHGSIYIGKVSSRQWELSLPRWICIFHLKSCIFRKERWLEECLSRSSLNSNELFKVNLIKISNFQVHILAYCFENMNTLTIWF